IEAIDAVRRLRELETNTHVPIVVMGDKEPEHLPEGVDGFIRKPVDNEELKSQVRRVVQA
ncbi:MAG: hypothetical protein KDD62_01200, partial [Bdellovibrionales bacterium]|nr:hypothetical protein [Bdellovibrionales bacterium]